MNTMCRMWMAAAIVAFTASCSNDDMNDIVGDGRPEIALNPLYPSTRVTDTNFEAKDRIGVFMVAENADLQIGGNELNNELFAYDGSAWKSQRKAYWNEGRHDIYAYYPYSQIVEDVDNYEFTVSGDQSAEVDGVSGYEASDFLWASAKGVSASASPVPMKFSHCMSRVKVKLEKNEDYSGEIPSDCEVFIHNMIPTALVDLQTGGVEASPYVGVNSVKCRKLSNVEYVACIVPQRIATRRPIVEVTTGNVSYLLEGTISLKQGYQSTVTVTLSKNPQQVAIEIGGSMGSWE